METSWMLKAGLTVILMTLTGVGAAAADYYKTTGNVAVYLGVLPAEIVMGHSPVHPAGKMDGGVPSAKKQHHVVVAVFDTKDGSRINNAGVTARVTELGLASNEKKLEPMTIRNNGVSHDSL